MKQYFETQANGKTYSAEVETKTFSELASAGTELAQQIITELGKKPTYPAALAEKIGVHEQKIYYHIKKLEAAGIITTIKEEKIGGSTAKYFALSAAVFCTIAGKLDTTTLQPTKQESTYLQPFIENGMLNAKIITGSPDPHGPEKARSRDGYYGIDLALFLGRYLHHSIEPSVLLDTEMREEHWKHNLILLGGPVTNRAVAKINEHLHITFDKERNNAVYSKISTQHYVEDEIGIIQKIDNPFSKGKKILMIAGKRHTGTKAAIITFLKNYDELIQGNLYKRELHARVVEGIDLDSDGQIDSVEFRE